MDTDRPSVKTDQDWCPCGALRPHHSCRHSPIMSDTVMSVTAIQTRTERKPQDKSVRRAEKLRRRAGMARLCGPINRHSGTLTIAAELGRAKLLVMRQDQANLPSSGMPRGECRFG